MVSLFVVNTSLIFLFLVHRITSSHWNWKEQSLHSIHHSIPTIPTTLSIRWSSRKSPKQIVFADNYIARPIRSYTINRREKRERNESDQHLIHERQGEQMLQLPEMNDAKNSHFLYFISTAVILSIHTLDEESSNKLAIIPPPHPVAMDASTADTTLPPDKTATSTPQEVTQWTRSRHSTVKLNI